MNPSPTGSPFIDSVFFIFGFDFDPERTDFFQPITLSGVLASFQKADALGGGFNYIMKDRNGGIATLPVRIGGIDGITDLAVGIHSSMGITFNLDALRAVHGPQKVGCFNAYWGMDSCPGLVSLYVYLSNDADGTIDERHFWGASGDNAELIHVEIPPSAQYLTLATGMEGDTYCDHGTFGQAIITESPCLESNLLALLHAGPRYVSTDGGTEVEFVGENLTAQHEYLICAFQPAIAHEKTRTCSVFH